MVHKVAASLILSVLLIAGSTSCASAMVDFPVPQTSEQSLEHTMTLTRVAAESGSRIHAYVLENLAKHQPSIAIERLGHVPGTSTPAYYNAFTHTISFNDWFVYHNPWIVSTNLVHAVAQMVAVKEGRGCLESIAYAREMRSLAWGYWHPNGKVDPGDFMEEDFNRYLQLNVQGQLQSAIEQDASLRKFCGLEA